MKKATTQKKAPTNKAPAKIIRPKVVLGGGREVTFISDTLFDDDLKVDK